MTGNELRKIVMKQCEAWSKSGKSRALTQSSYNSIQPYPRNWKLRTTDGFCAAFITAIFDTLDLSKYKDCIKRECGPHQMAGFYKELGQEVTRDEAQAGDIVWIDGHIGFFAEKYNAKYDRWMDMQAGGARYRNYQASIVKGYFAPDYDKLAYYLDIGYEPPRADWMVGDRVKIIEGANYWGGQSVPQKYIGKPYTISSVFDQSKKVVIKEINSSISTDYLVNLTYNPEEEQTVDEAHLLASQIAEQIKKSGFSFDDILNRIAALKGEK